MALFPDAELEVLLAAPGTVVPGTRLEGTLELRVPSPIPRAQGIDLFFRTTAVAIYGGGDQATKQSKDLFVAPFHVDIDTSRPLPAGKYSHPFSFEVPPWLPPAYSGTLCSIRHQIDVRLDVDWAKDPRKAFTPTVMPAPMMMDAEPLVLRSPRGWHPSLLIDVTLDRSVLVAGEPITGEVAIRGGQEAKFEAIELSLRSRATMVMSRHERRVGTGRKMRIPAERLIRGDSVRFKLDFPAGVPPTFRTGFIDHDVIFGVSAVVPWSDDPGFEVAVQTLPWHSKVRGPDDARPVVLGSDRLSRIAATMAKATGLTKAQLPLLVEGKVGPIRVRMTDGPRAGRVGVDVDFGLPDLELGITLRRLGALERFRESPMLPRRLAAGAYLLKVEKSSEALKRFFGALLLDLEPMNEVRLTDHHLGFHLVMRSDNVEEMVACAHWTKARAEAVAAAIAALPFAPIHPEAEAAWTATAREGQGFLLPHVPAIHGLTISTRILGGEPRELGVALRTTAGRTIDADLDLSRAPLPPEAGEPPAAVKVVFPTYRKHSVEKVTLEGAAFVADPRTLLPTLESFLVWLLEVRGERPTRSAYR